MSQIILTKSSTQIETPQFDKVTIYAKTDGFIYAKDDTGREVLLSNSEITLLDHLSNDNAHPQYLKKNNSNKIEYIEVSQQQIENKKIILDKTPINPQYVQADLKSGGGPLFFGEDFIVQGNEFLWDDLELDYIIEIGDRIRIIYDHN